MTRNNHIAAVLETIRKKKNQKKKYTLDLWLRTFHYCQSSQPAHQTGQDILFLLPAMLFIR